MLCWSCRSLGCVKRPISDGNVPEKLLSLKIKVFKLARRPIFEGKGPVGLFWLRFKEAKRVNSANSEGSRPDRLLEPTANDVVVSGS
jgi:hypothetical protein